MKKNANIFSCCRQTVERQIRKSIVFNELSQWIFYCYFYVIIINEMIFKTMIMLSNLRIKLRLYPKNFFNIHNISNSLFGFSVIVAGYIHFHFWRNQLNWRSFECVQCKLCVESLQYRKKSSASLQSNFIVTYNG